MPSTLKKITSFIAIWILLVSASHLVFAKTLNQSPPCKSEIAEAKPAETGKNTQLSKFCMPSGEAVELEYASSGRVIKFKFKNKSSIVDRIPAGYQPELVGASGLIRLLPADLQPYLGQNKVLYISANRSTNGKGSGQCGSGVETYVNVVDVNMNPARRIAAILIGSCKKSIEIAGSEISQQNLSGFSVKDNKLSIKFLNYLDKEGSPTGTLSTDLKELVFP